MIGNHSQLKLQPRTQYSYKQKNHIPLCSQYKNWNSNWCQKVFLLDFQIENSDCFVQFTVQCVYRSEVIFDSFIDSVFNFDAFGSFSKYIQTTVYVWIYCLFFSPSNSNKNQCGGIEFCHVCIWFNLSGATHLKFTHFIYISEDVHVYDQYYYGKSISHSYNGILYLIYRVVIPLLCIWLYYKNRKIFPFAIHTCDFYFATTASKLYNRFQEVNKFSRHKTPENREESKNKMKHEHLNNRIIRDLILCSSYLSCLVSNADFTANFIEPFTNCTHMEYSCQACCLTFFSLLVSRWRHYQMNAEKFPNQILTDLTCFPLVWHCSLYKKNAEHFCKWSSMLVHLDSHV